MIIFDGTPKEITDRLKNMGFEIPKFTTSIDYLMKIIDKDEIKIQYENTYGDVMNHDPRIIDKLYHDRINILVSQENKVNFLSKKSIISEERIKFKSLVSKKEYENSKIGNSTNSLEQSLLPDGIKKNESLLDYEARTRNQKRWMISQAFVLLGISMYNYYKQPKTYFVFFFQIIFANVIIMLVYHDLGDPEDDTLVAIQNRIGFMFMISTMSFMTGLQSSLLVFLEKKKLFLKDKDARIYDLSPFYFAQLTYTLPINLIVYAIVVVFYYYTLKLNSEPYFVYNMLYSYFFIFVGANLTGQSFSGILGALGDTIEKVATFVPFILLPVMLTAGFIGNLRSSIFIIQWLSYLSPMRFTFQGLSLVEFQDSSKYIDSCFTYAPCFDDPSKKCKVKIPEAGRDQCDPMKVTDFYEKDLLTNIIYVLGLLVIIRVIGLIIFKVKSSAGQIKYKRSQALISRFSYLANDLDNPRRSKLDPLNQLDSYVKEKMEEIHEDHSQDGVKSDLDL